MSTHLRIGFVSTRFAGTDGVSLEAEKWAAVLERLGHTCCCFAGSSDRPAGRSRAREMTEHDYELGRRYYSCATLERHLETLPADCFGEAIGRSQAP